MIEQNPADEPATDGAPATDFPVVAGAGQTFDDLDSATPLSAAATDQGGGGSSANGPPGGDAPTAEPGEG